MTCGNAPCYPNSQCPGVSGRGLGQRWLLQGQGHWVQQYTHGTFWRTSSLSALPPQLFGLRSNNREGTQPHPSIENWINDLLTMAPPIRTRSSFLLSQSLPSESVYKPLILLYQRADRMKTTVTENGPNWSHEPQSCLTQWNYEPCHVGPQKKDGSWWRVLIKCGPLEKGMVNHFSFLALKTPWTVWKGKK